MAIRLNAFENHTKTAVSLCFFSSFLYSIYRKGNHCHTDICNHSVIDMQGHVQFYRTSISAGL